MRYGLMMGLSPREPIGRFAALAQRAEVYGFDMAWVGDSQLVFKDAYIALTLAAQSTRTIGLGPGVTTPVTRHPTVIANSLAGLGEVSAGRAVLGIGVGDSSVAPLGLPPARIDELREVITVIRALCAGEEVDFAGSGLTLRSANFPVPVFVSASQPRMLRLAGEIADGVIILGAADASVTEWQLAHVEEGARRAGRTLDDLVVDLWIGLSITDARAAGMDEIRAYVTSQARWFHHWRDLPEALVPFKDEFRNAAEAYDFKYHVSRQAAHNASVSNELVELIGAVGTIDACVSRLVDLAHLKVDRLTFINFPGGREEHLRQIGEELIPGLEQALPAR